MPSFSKGAEVGEYEVVRAIGSGAMGEVYEAIHRMIGKRVAIKVMRYPATEAQTEARRMLEEARAVNAIRHPGIVDIFGTGALTDGRAYLVMELLEGLSLHEYLKSRGRLAIDDAFLVLEGILSALAAAHRAHVVHRDLKPTNIFVARTHEGRRIKLLDFGVARRKSREPLTAPQMTLGSLGFMAPEQMAGNAVPQSDLYAVGCIAWLLLMGAPVFPYGNVSQLTQNHLSMRPPPLSSLRPDVPRSLDRWIAMMLEKDPTRRFGSADSALSSLQDAATGEATKEANLVGRRETAESIAHIDDVETKKVRSPAFSENERVTVSIPPPPEDSPFEEEEKTIQVPPIQRPS